MKLTIEHLAPYLPYGLKIHDPNRNMIGLEPLELNCTGGTNYFSLGNVLQYEELLPILRPMSDIYKSIDDVTHANVLYREFDITDMEFNGSVTHPKHGYDVYLYLFQYHFDVFGLIEQGLAIDINNLPIPQK